MKGPHWFKGATVGATQADAEGERWQVDDVELGGRVIHWRSMKDSRTARTEVVAAHPDYPSDEAVLAAKRAYAKIKKAAGGNYWP